MDEIQKKATQVWLSSSLKEKITLEEARGLAAQAWCHDSCGHLVLDVDLAKAFASILMDKINWPTRNNPIKAARQVLRQAFIDDPDFKQSYVSNIAMLLHDSYGVTNYETRNAAAEDILNLIFG